MMRTILRLLGVIILGGIGGVLMVGLLLPSLKDASFIHAVPFLAHVAEGTTVVQPTQQLVVDENSALEASIQNAQKNVVQIQATNKSVINTAAGLLLTNDGIVIFPYSQAQAQNTQYLVRASGGDWTSAAFLAQDSSLGLTLIRAQGLHLTPVNFGDIQTLHLGQRIFALGTLLAGQNFVADGIVTLEADQQQNGQTSLHIDPQQGNGAGLFSLDGQLFGIFITKQKEISLVSSSDIQAFLQSTFPN